jgi:hypothetical protein
MASLSRKIRLQQLSCQLLEDLSFCIRTPRPAAGALGAGAMRKLRQVQPIPALWSFMAMAISSGVMPAGKAISGPARSKSAAEVAPAGYALQAP